MKIQSCSTRWISIALLMITTLGSWFGTQHWIATTEGQTVADDLTLNFPTMGGTQLWTDHAWRNGYQVQQNALTGHYRLLDPENRRICSGNRQEVLATFQSLQPEPPAPGQKPIVVLVHGLMRTDNSMKSLEKKLQEAGYTQTIRFGYASTRHSMDQSASALEEVLQCQHPDAEFCFVGHSMGNIVTRRLIHELQHNGDPHHVLPRCRAMVMLGPPNQGALIAKRLGLTGVFGWVAGKGAMQLGPDWNEISPRLATPPFPFAVVAGHVNPVLANPLSPAPGDFVVSLEEAKLDGARVVHEVPVLHSFLMNDPDTQAWTVQFIDSIVQTSS